MHFSISDTIIARCFAHPDRPAIQVVGTPEAMSYAEVWRRISALAGVLARCAPGRHGRMAGLLLPNGADAALAIAACQHAGVTAVPVNGRLTQSEMQFIMRDADIGLLLTGGELAKAAEHASQPLGIETVRVEDVETPASAPRPELGLRELGSEPAIVGYTSGTTGFPKGAVYTHDYYTMNNYRWGWTFGLSYDHVVLIAGPMFHISYAGFALAGLSAGCLVRVMPRFQPEVAIHELQRHCSFAFLVPSMLTMVAEKWEQLGRPLIGAARHIISAGAPASPTLLRTAMKVFPNARIAEMYGWTEGAFATYEIKDPDTLVPNCVGWPALGAEVVVFSESGEPCGIGEAGEVGVRSGVPFAGYLGNPAATEAGMYRGFVMSGDIGSWLPDGRLCIVDRKKDVIISGGENVYTAEVERVLLDHPLVAEAAVVGIPDPRWGECVTALLVLVENAGVGKEELQGYCREHLAGYKCPRRIELVAELPRNSMGKVQKFRIVEALAAR